MGCILVGEQTGKGFGLLRIIARTFHRSVVLLILHETDVRADVVEAAEHVAEEQRVIVVGMEHTTFLGRGAEQDNRPRHLINGRELHLALVNGIRTASQHIIDLDATHVGIRGEVNLELSVFGTCREITDADDLG